MKQYSFSIFFFLLSISVFPQEILPAREFGSFVFANAFFLIDENTIYVADGGNGMIYKINNTGTRLKETGGFGWQDGSFDHPADIFANQMRVYVADMNNHRIQEFDKDLILLNILTSDEKKTEEEFRYPVSCIVSPLGDHYILDSYNKRIVKFDPFRSFSLQFGGYSWGEYALKTPAKIKFFGDRIAALDDNRIIFYNRFGEGLYILTFPESIIDFAEFRPYIFTIEKRGLVMYRIEQSNELSEVKCVKIDATCISLQMIKNLIYILTPTTIQQFQILFAED